MYSPNLLFFCISLAKRQKTNANLMQAVDKRKSLKWDTQKVEMDIQNLGEHIDDLHEEYFDAIADPKKYSKMRARLPYSRRFAQGISTQVSARMSTEENSHCGSAVANHGNRTLKSSFTDLIFLRRLMRSVIYKCPVFQASLSATSACRSWTQCCFM
jgi:hypothetical protein